MKKAAKNVAYDVCDSKKARINKLKKMEKDSKQKLEKSPEDIKKEEQSKATFLASYEERKNENYMTIDAFEHILFTIEGFHIIVRASRFAKIRSYPYKKRCGNNNTVEYFINKRLRNEILFFPSFSILSWFLSRPSRIVFCGKKYKITS